MSPVGATPLTGVAAGGGRGVKILPTRSQVAPGDKNDGQAELGEYRRSQAKTGNEKNQGAPGAPHFSPISYTECALGGSIFQGCYFEAGHVLGAAGGVEADLLPAIAPDQFSVYSLGEGERALEAYHKALELYQRTGNRTGEAAMTRCRVDRICRPVLKSITASAPHRTAMESFRSSSSMHSWSGDVPRLAFTLVRRPRPIATGWSKRRPAL